MKAAESVGRLMSPTLQLLTLADLKLSDSEAQVERRAHFDKKALKELAVSIDTQGMLQPIVVRELELVGGRSNHIVVAGERRYMAAALAGWAQIPCNVRKGMTDAQVIEVQLTENLDREPLHELAEAQGYASLVELGLNAEQIAAKFGRSSTYVLRRLRLKTLSKACRRAFYDGKIGFTQALELAKLPIEKHQDELLEEILDVDLEFDAPLSAERIREQLEERFLSDLAGVSFPTGDPTLVAKAGACAACPKRTGAQGALFDQVKGLGHCLDLVCFNGKKLAHSTLLLEEAKARGQKVITGKAAEKIAPHGSHNSLVGYVDLAHQLQHRGKSLKQLLGKDYQPTLLQLKNGEVLQVAPAADAKKVQPAAAAPERDDYKAKQRREEKARKVELEYRAKVLRGVLGMQAPADPLEDLRQACEAMGERLHHDGKKRLFKVMDWPVIEKKQTYGGPWKDYNIAKVVAGVMTEVELWQMLRILSVAGDLEVYNNQGPPDRSDRLHKLAKRLGFNSAGVLEKLKAEAAAKAKPKKKAKAVRK